MYVGEKYIYDMRVSCFSFFSHSVLVKHFVISECYMNKLYYNLCLC